MNTNNLASRIDQLAQQIVQAYTPSKIILFGSAAGSTLDVNDIDLLIIKENVPHTGAERIRQLYRMIDTDLPVDYLVYRPEEIENRIRLGDPFISSVLHEGKVLYG